jgi:hypothetical protein
MPRIPPRDKPSPNGHDHRKLFEQLGVVFAGDSSGSNVRAEECPFCGGAKFYVNPEDGLWDCKQCQKSGNVTNFLTLLHAAFLRGTTGDDYLELKARRKGVASQTLKLHGLAYAASLGCWLIPFRNPKGNVFNLMRYYPDWPKPNKLMLKGLPTAIYGFDKLPDADKKSIVFVCEGPFDAIALDWNIGATKRGKYVIVATPGAFKEEWVEHFRGRKVRVLYDNDKGGREQSERVGRLLGERGVADEVRILKWPEGFADGYDLNDLATDPERKGLRIIGWSLEHSYPVVREPKLAWVTGADATAQGDERIDWPWPNHLRCGTYCSFSGMQGTLKSTLARDLVARYTTGEPFPGCEEVGLPAGHLVYVTAEDSVATVAAALQLAGADLGKVHILPAVLKDGDSMNVLEHLDELRQRIQQFGVRFVIVDGQNSVVGAPCIATDMLARHNVTNKLHQFAQKENVCLLGIRNEDKGGRALGPQSMGDLARCVLRAVELQPLAGRRYFELQFVKVSDAAPSTHPAIPYSVEDLGGSSRRILWGEVRPDEYPAPPSDGLKGIFKTARDPG